MSAGVQFLTEGGPVDHVRGIPSTGHRAPHLYAMRHGDCTVPVVERDRATLAENSSDFAPRLSPLRFLRSGPSRNEPRMYAEALSAQRSIAPSFCDQNWTQKSSVYV